MCGIFGVLTASDVPPSEAKLRQSIESLSHRGPDASVVHAEPGLGLGHARLSLVDTHARSNQPFWDETGRYVLVFNGEIYNFRSLRAELEAAGHIFQTTSDTEVLLRMLISVGPEQTLPRLNGMYAFAFYDRSSETLTLARDRFGMKPLFFIENDGEFLFASEIKAFKPWHALHANHASINAYLMKFGGPTKGRTFYQGIESLAPGDMLQVKRGGPSRTHRFFRVSDLIDVDEHERLRGLSATQIADQFDALMQQSVADHAFADAKVGAFCSGGVDSSLIVSMAARQQSDIQLFHANVKGRWSEAEPARALARHLGLELHAIDVEEQDFLTSIPKVMRHYEYPFTYHPNCAPLMMIAQLARDRGVKGLLSGEGSDELFLGYPWLGRRQITDVYNTIKRVIGNGIRGLPGLGPILNPDQTGNSFFVRDIMNGREIVDDLNDVTAAISQYAHAQKDPKVRWTLDYLNYHLRTLLLRNDTMGMAARIEARFPFLGNDLTRFGVNLPGRHKLKTSPFVFEKAHPFIRDKWVVRAVADRYVPKSLSQRIKIGFWTTVFQRLDISDAFFESSKLGDLMSLSRKQVQNLIGEASDDLKLRMLHLDVWVRICLEDEADEISIARLVDHVRIREDGAPRARKSRPKAVAYPSAPT